MPDAFDEIQAIDILSGPPKLQGDAFDQIAKKKPLFSEQFKQEFSSEQESPFEQGIGQATRAATSAIGSIPRNLMDLNNIAGDFIYDKIAHYLGLSSSKEFPARSKPFPNEEEIKQSFDKYTEDKYQPQTEFDRRAQEFTGDLFSMLIPVKGKIPFFKAIGAAAAGQGGKELAKGFKAEEGTQDLVKQGTMLLTSLINPKAGEKFVADSFAKFKAKIPASTPINTQQLDSDLGGFITQLEKGLGKTVADKAKVLAPAEALKKKAMSNFMELDDLLEAKIDINRIMGEPETLKGAQKYLKGLAKIVDESVEKIAHVDPEALKLYRNANSTYGALRQSEKTGKAIQNVLTKHPLKSAGAAFAMDALMGIPISTIAKGTATGFAALKGFEILKRFVTNKQFAGLYFNLIKEGATQNQAGITKYLKKIDQEAKKEESPATR